MARQPRRAELKLGQEEKRNGGGGGDGKGKTTVLTLRFFANTLETELSIDGVRSDSMT